MPSKQTGATTVFNKSKLALPVAVILGAIGPASVALAGGGDNDEQRGGFVMPCSLDGVNPVYHPHIFGNPAVARSYGFVQGPDHTWHVISNCSGWGRRY
jgi:hypothetical protein